MLVVNKILVPRDFSSVSSRVLRHGFALAAKMEAQLDVLHVTNRADSPYPAHDLPAVRDELRQAGVAAEALRSVIVEGVTRQGDDVAETIRAYADEEEVDLIAVGTHGRRGPRRVLLGSVAEAVVRRADRPVLTVRGEGEQATARPGQIERILVPVDFSEYALEASRVAVEWGRLFDAQVDLLHVLTKNSEFALSAEDPQAPSEADGGLEARARRALLAMRKNMNALNVPIDTHVQAGSATDTIHEFVEAQDADFVVMSTHGRTGMERFLLGSVAETVVRSVPCPVLTVRAFGRSIRALSS